MAQRKYKFSYTPQYSDLLYLGVFLLGSGTIALLNHPMFIPLVWIAVIIGIYFFVKRKPILLFYIDHVEIRKGFGKSKEITVISYSDVQFIHYVFSETGRGNLFRITFLQLEKTRSIQYTFMGNPTKNEITFFESKGITLKVTPASAKYKLYPPVK